MSRLAHRVEVVLRALARPGAGAAPREPRRILIAHQLLLGDTLMTSALAARLRQRHPQAELVMALPPAFAPLYAGRPFGLRAVGFRPDQPATLAALRREGPFDWAVLPGDNRFSWLARAAGCGWVTGWAHDRPASKNWMVDDPRPWPEAPGALVDLWADLLPDGPVAGAAPPQAAPRFRVADWPEPPAGAFLPPEGAYVVLHVGASNPRKFWPAHCWQSLAEGLEQAGYRIVLSGGKGEEALASMCDPKGRWLNLAGRLDLAGMWHLLRQARLLVAPDTGIAHLGKITGTPTLALFGAGPTPVYARGRFFSEQPFHCLVLDELPARPQSTLFRRPFPWLPALSRHRHAQPDIHYGAGSDFVLERSLEAAVPP